MDDPVVTLCKLDFKSYAKSPHSFSMFKSLVAASNCDSSRTKKERLSSLRKNILNNEKEPSGFVFHESRVGSTLTANLLASNPNHMVFSESDPPATVLLHCDDCSRERQIQLFRDILFVMGSSPIHQKYFFKFQSITSTKMDIALEV